MSDDPTYPFDAIAVLGAALAPDGTPPPAMARRVTHAALRFGQGCAPRLLMVGGYGPPTRPRPPVTEARAMADLATGLGVPVDAIHLEEVSTRTLENAVCTRAAMDAHGWSRVLLVTDAYHLPRALWCFRWAGVRCSGSAPWSWRPGGVASWLAGWGREAVAAMLYGWMIATGRAARIAEETRRGIQSRP